MAKVDKVEKKDQNLEKTSKNLIKVHTQKKRKLKKIF